MMYDIAIIGSGAAGETAALYALRAKKSVLLLEKGSFGGQIAFSPRVENFPTRTVISGAEFADALTEQVLSHGVDVEIEEVVGIMDLGDYKEILTDTDTVFQAKSVIIATGARHRMLGLDRAQELVGNGISFCAVCDGAFFADKHVGVVGGGNSALQEAVLLSEQCSKVTIVQNLDELTGEQALQDQLRSKNNVAIITGVTVSELLGEKELTGIKIKNAAGEHQELALDGLFIAIGLQPQNEPFADVMTLDDYGYAASGEDCTTKTPGVFVAGDCRQKRIRQLTTACADGSIAALAACRYLETL